MAFVNQDGGIYAIRTPQGEFLISDLPACEVRPLNDTKFQVILHNKVYLVHLDQVDAEYRHFRFQLGHEFTDIELIRNIDHLIQNMGLNQSRQTWVEDLMAPMPGLVKKILVASQDKVVIGQNLIILEAMKMENVIKSPQTGKIKHLGIAENQTVDKGQLLIRFEL